MKDQIEERIHNLDLISKNHNQRGVSTDLELVLSFQVLNELHRINENLKRMPLIPDPNFKRVTYGLAILASMYSIIGVIINILINVIL